MLRTLAISACLHDLVVARTVLSSPRQDVPKAERAACWFALIDAMAAMHNVDFKVARAGPEQHPLWPWSGSHECCVQAAGLADYGANSGYFERQSRSLSKVCAVIHVTVHACIPSTTHASCNRPRVPPTPSLCVELPC